jgi:uncharacterized protein
LEGRVAKNRVRILCLDGGGAKGFYTLGALREIEKLAEPPLCQHFRLIYGTSTGAIIASLLALGHSVDEIFELYAEHVPKIMKPFLPKSKTAALRAAAEAVFGDKRSDLFKTDVGVVATNYDTETPIIFKTSVDQAYLGKSSFIPFFGCTIADAVQASCSAYPFFKPHTIATPKKQVIKCMDGGYCANNPTLYAIADALGGLKTPPENLRVISVGVGLYPEPKRNPRSVAWWLNKWPGVRFWQKTLEVNTQSMDRLRNVLYSHIPTVRINEAYIKPEMATDLLERNRTKLDLLHSRGADSVREHENKLKEFFA